MENDYLSYEKRARLGDGVFPNMEHPLWEVKFYSSVKRSTEAQISMGKEPYYEVDCIRMQPRAESLPLLITDREVDLVGIPSEDPLVRRLSDDKRFPYEWAQYKNGKQEANEGISLSFATFLSAADKAYLTDKGIRTIEQLAYISAQAAKQIGSNTESLSIKAKEFLSKAENAVEVARISSENEDLRKELLALKERFNSLEEQPQSDDFVKTRGRKKDAA